MLIVIEVLEKNFAHDENVSREAFDIIYSGLEKYYSELREMLISERKICNIKGRWIKTAKAVMGEGYMWYCSACNHQVYQDSSRNYPSEKFCPNCGANMEVKE